MDAVPPDSTSRRQIINYRTLLVVAVMLAIVAVRYKDDHNPSPLDSIAQVCKEVLYGGDWPLTALRFAATFFLRSLQFAHDFHCTSCRLHDVLS